jgi:hypothetical protein
MGSDRGEIRASRERDRSPPMLRCAQDGRSGRRYSPAAFIDYA